MATSKRDAPPLAHPADHADRRAVVHERSRNVVVDAGAGTGKTTLIVERLVEMIAPTDDALAAVPLGRLAAVTFTRKAAGELRLRVREKILTDLAGSALTEARRARLHEAVAGIDHAHIGTIHSFADRLLRMFPVEAKLSPSYDIAEDADALHEETFELLLASIQRGSLEAELSGTKAEGRAAEAATIVQTAIEAGLLIESVDHAYGVRFGLDALFASMLEHRDVPVADREPLPFERDAFVRCVDEFLLRASEARGRGAGPRWFARAASTLREMRDEKDVAKIYKRVGTVVDQGGRDFQKKHDFEGDDAGYTAWKAFNGDKGKKAARATPLRDDLMDPLHAWIARRLVRLLPVLEVLYEKVKTRHRVVDHIDLLLRLRNLLAERSGVRAELQALFDHIFIDEFQDTDPLQAEVMLFLCEARDASANGAPSNDAWAVKLARGKVTIVGDPKQSIYRFRRADVATYDRVRRKLAETGPLEATLRVNFRSSPGLIDWYNDRFSSVLGEGKDGARFDASTGQVFHAPLEAGLTAPGVELSTAPADVEIITLAPAEDNVDEVRGMEARALARYVRWLVEESGTQVADPVTRERRAIRHGDVAVLAVITTNLGLLCRAFDAARVPYTTSGGKLFMQDELHQRFVLGLRALADREDGVAQAALMRPPFFAIDLGDLARSRGAEAPAGGKVDEGVRRVSAAKELIAELRRDRAARTPGATARDLLEKTAIGRAVALGPNGSQRLFHLRELCVELDVISAREGYDFDAATYAMRKWIGAPPQIDPPKPVDDRAVRVSTVHQAKGLEFPVVVLWDSRCLFDTREFTPAWAVDRETRSWAMKVDPRLTWDEPAGAAYAEREKKYRDAERRRLIYVAATRAREKLVIAVAPGGRGECVNAVLAATCGSAKLEARVKRWSVFEEAGGAVWPEPGAAPSQSGAKEAEDASTLDVRIDREWRGAIADAGRARFQRVAASALSKLDEDAETEVDLEPPRVVKHREGRFGPVFGDTVHRALALVVERKMTARDAVARAAREKELAAHLDEALADVERTMATLGREGLLGGVCRLEYPVAIDEVIAGEPGSPDTGLLVVGSIDLVRADAGDGDGGALDVIDFKTDRAPKEGERVEDTHAGYVAQVKTYARMLAKTGVSAGKRVRCGLLFTETGRVLWV